MPSRRGSPAPEAKSAAAGGTAASGIQDRTSDRPSSADDDMPTKMPEPRWIPSMLSPRRKSNRSPAPEQGRKRHPGRVLSQDSDGVRAFGDMQKRRRPFGRDRYSSKSPGLPASNQESRPILRPQSPHCRRASPFSASATSSAGCDSRARQTSFPGTGSIAAPLGSLGPNRTSRAVCRSFKSDKVTV